jgi:excisionase family DNA binding protein
MRAARIKVNGTEHRILCCTSLPGTDACGARTRAWRLVLDPPCDRALTYSLEAGQGECLAAEDIPDEIRDFSEEEATSYDEQVGRLAPRTKFAVWHDDDGNEYSWLVEVQEMPLSPDEVLAVAERTRREKGADMLTIRQAAEYARVDERTIRDWIDRRDGDKPMLPGAIKAGRKVSIPRTDLDPWRKAAKATRPPKKTNLERSARKPVKRKS